MRTLVVVDIQNDFLPGGSLAVKNGDIIIPLVNKLMPVFDLVVATQDWHPENHESFASNHPGRSIGECIDLNGIPQVLWPDHCIQNSKGAEFAVNLNLSIINQVFRKGTDASIDSYSGFFDNGKQRDTGLAQYLRSYKDNQIFVVGLATDYCIKYTALDAVRLGFETTVILDAVKAVNLNPDDGAIAIKLMQDAGVLTINSHELER